MSPRIFAAWWVACLLWSSTFLFIRIGVAAVPPLTFAYSRLVVALCILAPLAAFSSRASHLSVADVTRVMGAGVLLLGVNYGLVYWGAQFVPSGLVAILQAGTPIVALGLGWASGSERVTQRKVAAAAAGMLGVVLIFGAEARASGARAVLGAVAVTGGSVCVALAYVWFKGYGKRLPPLTVTALQCAAGICVLVPVAFIHEGNPAGIAWTAPAVGALLYLALGWFRGGVLAELLAARAHGCLRDADDGRRGGPDRRPARRGDSGRAPAARHAGRRHLRARSSCWHLRQAAGWRAHRRVAQL